MTVNFRKLALLAVSITVSALAGYQMTVAQDEARNYGKPGRISASHQRQHGLFRRDQHANQALPSLAATPCVGGMADIYPCDNVDLLAFMPLNTIGGGSGNDIWGWTDPNTGTEYAIMGRTNGTAFVDISDPENPVYVANVPTQTSNSSWRDIKVYADHAFIVSEAFNHGMQVVDLSELATIGSPPATLNVAAHYTGVSNSHNIVINEDSGYAYLVGTNTCSGGLHMVDIGTPTLPTFAGCVSSDGYTHDAQCVTYAGPDADYQGQEICVNANEDTVTIFDVSVKISEDGPEAPVQISRTGYPGDGYTHQGWLTEDHRYYLLDDELDEQSFGHNTRTRIFDVTDLDNPILIGTSDGPNGAIDHNLYIKDGFAYQANYRAGLAVLDATDVASGNLSQSGSFDIYPNSNSANFNGAWSVYPFFESGVVVVSGIEQGLFVLDPSAAVGGGGLSVSVTSTETTAMPGGSFPIDMAVTNDSGQSEQVAVVLAVLLPGQGQPNFLISPTPVQLDAGETADFNVDMPIPQGAPLGQYTVVGVVADPSIGQVVERTFLQFSVAP